MSSIVAIVHLDFQGPSVLQLLERLFVQSQCAYRLEHYWTYELCHGKNLRQYHEEREGKGIKTTEYFLGYYNTEMHTENKKGIHLLWSLTLRLTIRVTRDKEMLKCQTLELFYFLDVLQQTST